MPEPTGEFEVTVRVVPGMTREQVCDVVWTTLQAQQLMVEGGGPTVEETPEEEPPLELSEFGSKEELTLGPGTGQSPLAESFTVGALEPVLGTPTVIQMPPAEEPAEEEP
jgi:hypothetical protein